MPSSFVTSSRKDAHLTINLSEDVRSHQLSGFDSIQLTHCALPECAFEDVTLQSSFLGYTLGAPFLISAMTGGSKRAEGINRSLASAANVFKIPFALGSMRALLENQDLLSTFDVRDQLHGVPLLANIGAVQLNEGVTPDDCTRLVDLVQADALVLHLNVLQELLQPEGNHNWRGLLPKIESLTRSLSVPVLVKEVGYGLSSSVAKRLLEVGVWGLDVAGAGGTSWSQVEAHRCADPLQKQLAESFRGWGIPTVTSLKAVRTVLEDNGWTHPLIASGGILSGLDGAKALALGADLFGSAGPLLRAVNTSEEALHQAITLIIHQLKIAMMCVGATTLQALRSLRSVDSKA